jgi:hypothetical protein
MSFLKGAFSMVYLNPISVGIIYKINTHLRIFKTYTPIEHVVDEQH